MQYVSFKVRPDDRWFHPVDEKIADEPGMRHGPIHNLDLLNDGSMVILYEVYGDQERVKELLETHGDAHFTDTTPMGDDTLVFTHGEPSEGVKALLETASNQRILIDLPITFSDDDELEVTVIGDSKAIQETFAATPTDMQVTVEKTGQYRPGRQRVFTELTDRQQEILLTALAMGYYEDPRQTTYGEIAEEVGCTATTVGEHLRKIERYVLMEVTPENAAVPPSKA